MIRKSHFWSLEPSSNKSPAHRDFYSHSPASDPKLRDTAGPLVFPGCAALGCFPAFQIVSAYSTHFPLKSPAIPHIPPDSTSQDSARASTPFHAATCHKKAFNSWKIRAIRVELSRPMSVKKGPSFRVTIDFPTIFFARNSAPQPSSSTLASDTQNHLAESQALL
jgi:hypothetical protein